MLGANIHAIRSAHEDGCGWESDVDGGGDGKRENSVVR